MAGKEEFIAFHSENKATKSWAEGGGYDTATSNIRKIGPAAKRFRDLSNNYFTTTNTIAANSDHERISDLQLSIEIDASYENFGARQGGIINSMESTNQLFDTLRDIHSIDNFEDKISMLDEIRSKEEQEGTLTAELSGMIDQGQGQLRQLKNALLALGKPIRLVQHENAKLKKALEKDKYDYEFERKREEKLKHHLGYGEGSDEYEDKQKALDKSIAALDATKDIFSVGELQNNIGATFREQCILQANIVKLIKIKRNIIEAGTPRDIPYAFDGKNKALDIEGEPFGFMNKLTQPVTTAALFSLPPAILSQLQPYIRLYKIGYDENGKDAEEIPIEFPSHFGQETDDVGALLKSSKRRGHGVGLKSFNFTYDGSDPFSVKKSIKASLEIFASSFEEIMDDRGGYAYSDLALKTGSSQMAAKTKKKSSSADLDSNLSKLNFRLKAVIGYSYPKNLVIPSGTSLSIEQVKRAVYNSFVSINLTPTVHEFDFDDTGRLTFKINYLAYVEDFFDQAYYNIFSDIRSTTSIFKRRMELKMYQETCQIENAKEIRKKEKELMEEEIQASMQTLVGSLFNQNLVYGLSLSYDDMLEAAIDPTFDLAEIEKIEELPGGLDGASEIATAVDDSKEAKKVAVDIKNQSPLTNSTRYEQLAFFFLDDLVDVVLSNIEESLSEKGYQKALNEMKDSGTISSAVMNQELINLQRHHENFKRLRIILGPVELKDPQNPGMYMLASLGDIPISAKYFIEWMTDRVLAKDRVYYSLSKFINDFVKSYLRNFLNDDKCYGQISKQRITFYSSNITSYGFQNGPEVVDEISKLISNSATGKDDYQGRLNIDTIDGSGILNIMGERNSPLDKLDGAEINYMTFFAGRSHPVEVQNGDIFEDSSRGVFHYILGRDSGMIKNIKLDRTTITGLKELRFEQEGFDGLEQLREVYDVSIDTFAMPTVVPGTYIFVDPRGFAPESVPYDPSGAQQNKSFGSAGIELTKFGIGGYFMVTKAETTLREGLAETKISAKWVAALESDPTEAGEAEGEIESNPSTHISRKCEIKKTPAPTTKRGIQKTAPDTVATNPDAGAK